MEFHYLLGLLSGGLVGLLLRHHRGGRIVSGHSPIGICGRRTGTKCHCNVAYRSWLFGALWGMEGKPAAAGSSYLRCFV